MAGRGDCDGNPRNGCETNLDVEDSSCGTCGLRCELSHATARCAEGTCAIVSCEPGFGDCDGVAANGCEVALINSASHCGACGRACAPGERCITGGCVPPCPAGRADCDLDGTCEADLATSSDHCGACNASCPATAPGGARACAAGLCELRCDADHRDCDGASANGCEVDPAADRSHCGDCGRPCGAGEACFGGACDVASPQPWRPQSVTLTTSRRPTFAWHLPPGVDGARVEICADRACTRVEHAADVTGNAYRPPMPLGEGTHFWRLRGRVGARTSASPGPTWLFRAPATESAYDTAWQRLDDVDGDGVEDTASGDELRLSATGRTWRSANWSVDTDGLIPGRFLYSTSWEFGGDIDGDGYGDLAGILRSTFTSDSSTGKTYLPWFKLVWFRGGPAGPVSDRGTDLNGESYSVVFDWYPSPWTSYPGDADGDGRADVLLTIVWESLTHFRTDDNVAALSSRDYRPTSVGSFFSSRVQSLGDIDGDGLTDVLLSMRRPTWPDDSAPPSSRVDLRSPSPTFTPIPACGASFPARYAEDVLVADANADGLADLTLVAYSDGSTGVRRSYFGGPGGFAADRCEVLPGTP